MKTPANRTVRRFSTALKYTISSFLLPLGLASVAHSDPIPPSQYFGDYAVSSSESVRVGADSRINGNIASKSLCQVSNGAQVKNIVVNDRLFIGQNAQVTGDTWAFNTEIRAVRNAQFLGNISGFHKLSMGNNIIAAGNLTSAPHGTIAAYYGTKVSGNVISDGEIWAGRNIQFLSDVSTNSALTLGANSTVSGNALYGTTVNLAPSAMVGSLASGNVSVPSPGTWKFSGFPPFGFDVSDANIIVKKGQSIVLPPNVKYGKLYAESGATIYMSLGIYTFKNIRLGKDVTINVLSSSNSSFFTVGIKGDLVAGENFHLNLPSGTDAGYSLLAADGGFKLGKNSSWSGSVSAQSRLFIGSNSVVNGSLYSTRSALLDRSVTVNYVALN